jgi:hypothetical protein
VLLGDFATSRGLKLVIVPTPIASVAGFGAYRFLAWAGMVRFRDRQAKAQISFRIDARVLACIQRASMD